MHTCNQTVDSFDEVNTSYNILAIKVDQPRQLIRLTRGYTHSPDNSDVDVFGVTMMHVLHHHLATNILLAKPHSLPSHCW